MRTTPVRPALVVSGLVGLLLVMLGLGVAIVFGSSTSSGTRDEPPTTEAIARVERLIVPASWPEPGSRYNNVDPNPPSHTLFFGDAVPFDTFDELEAWFRAIDIDGARHDVDRCDRAARGCRLSLTLDSGIVVRVLFSRRGEVDHASLYLTTEGPKA